MNIRKGRLFWFLTVILSGLLLSSCGASLSTIRMEVRQPSEYYVETDDRSLAVFSTIRHGEDSTVNVQISKALSEYLEQKLILPEGSVSVFNHHPGDTLDYDAEYIRQLALKADADILFILKGVWANEPFVIEDKRAESRSGSYLAIMPILSEVSVYDGITADILASFISKDSLVIMDLVSRSDLRRSRLSTLFYQYLIESAGEIAESLGERFFDKWIPVERYLYYFNDNDWKNALQFANSFRWSDAARIWLEKTSSKDPLTSACAAFNMALVCEVSGNKKLAVDWLDFASKRYSLNTIESYRNYLIK